MTSKIFFWASIVFGIVGAVLSGLLVTPAWIVPVICWTNSILFALWNIGAILKEKDIK